MDEISIDFTGEPPEVFKMALFTLIKETMKDIKKEVLENNGKIRLDYNSDNDIQLRADCRNPETRMKMTVILQAVLTKIGLN